MLYAKVVLGLPVEGPFDYLVPESLEKKIKAGSRVKVGFRTSLMVGYVVGLSHKSAIKNLKPVTTLIDEEPLLSAGMLELAKELAGYYCCSWGEAIETALPEPLRKGKPLPASEGKNAVTKNPSSPVDAPEVLLVHDLSAAGRRETYLNRIKEELNRNKSSIIILPDIQSFDAVGNLITERLGAEYVFLFRKQPQEIETWAKVKSGKVKIVIGTRSAIFAPLDDLGLIIVDEEQDPVYKQDQVPHYHCREVAFMRSRIAGAGLLLGSTAPSLESFYLAKKEKAKYVSIPSQKKYPEIKLIDMQAFRSFTGGRNVILSKYLEDSILQTCIAQGKTLLFINRRGFATAASCISCGKVLKCPRCNLNLVYHFSQSLLACHHCNYKLPAPKLCPECKTGLIRYSGSGTEKIESELSRLFPQARIKIISDPALENVKGLDILISTESVIRNPDYNFDLIGVLSIDNSLNRLDFRAGEKAFGLLAGLLRLTDKKLVIQTEIPQHHCFQALVNKDPNVFYTHELSERKQLQFPPYAHIGLVKLRHPQESKVREAAEALFQKLNESDPPAGLKVLSVAPGQPEKLRNNFYWQILLKAGSANALTKFLKTRLKNFRHSGIIVTVDIDPV